MHIAYLFDPLCGWCYGASPMLEQLIDLQAFEIELCPTGLFADRNARPMNKSFADYAWSNDQRIERLTGQRFTEHYQNKVLADHASLFDSGPATRALTAVAATAPTLEFAALKAIQQARYVKGLDITDPNILAQTLSDIGLRQAADVLTAQGETLLALNEERLAKSRSMMERLGVNGVPALVVGQGSESRLVSANGLFASLDTLVSSLRTSK